MNTVVAGPAELHTGIALNAYRPASENTRMKIKAAIGGAVAAVLATFVTGCNPTETAPAPVAAPETTPEPAPPPTPAFPAGDSKFEAWYAIGAPVVHDADVKAPDGTMTADAVDMKLNDGLGMLDTRPVNAGDTRRTSIYLWGPAGQNVALQLVNWCSATTPEVETNNIVLTAEPVEYTISHTFANKHDCSRFQFILIDNTTATINAWNARLE